ncbi:MAG: hypothetical protein NTZ05_08810, partial [Chloroflexi bacterium]|nr:hypothetical protein [Chloroflexota bacterium]
MTGPVTSTGGPPPDASDAVRARCGTPETPGVGRVPPVGIITGSKQGLQTLIQDGAGHLIHVNQTDIDAGTVNVPLVGQALFEREFRRDEGRGPVGFQSSCAACHGIPVEGGHRISVVGGAGPRLRDLLPASDPPAVPLRRNTPHLFGAALLTQLGNERHRDPKDPTKRLPATDANAEPHNWKGTVKSLRDFTSIAFTGALGMNPTETVATRLGVSLAEAATRDFDHDGVANELSVGDITAIEVFQAMLPRPIRRDPTHPRVQSGQQVFAAIGCARCHTPVQMLENPTYQVTNPETKAVMTIPLGDRAVELYSDLKRHKMGSPLAEAAPQG